MSRIRDDKRTLQEAPDSVKESAPGWEGVAVLCKSADGKALLMVLQGHHEETPTWAVPGGSIEPGETPEQAAVRETKEETGLEVCILHRHTVVEGVREYGPWRVYYFEAEVMGGQVRISDPEGLIHQVAWVPASELPGLTLTHPDQERILTSFMEGGGE